MKYISVLGSTGSVGTQTLDVVRKNPKRFKITGLTANKNILLLKKQIKEFKPNIVAVMDEDKAKDLKKQVNIKVLSGMKGIIEVACYKKTDTVLNSLVGSVGLKPTVMAIRSKKNIALANKETLVTAGIIVMKEIKKHKVKLTPVDSEHSAIFQCINGENSKKINRLIITASGGPFKNHSKKQLEKVKVENALKHPTWSMGAKITIDSSTLMNKGFEVIEAHWLFDIPYEKIDVVVHPQSIVHSLVEFIDKSVIAQLSLPTMKIPIQYALSYPERIINNFKQLNLADIENLTFYKPNLELFPCLKLGFEVGKKDGTLPAVLNAANEIAVSYFLHGKIKFMDIPKIIYKMLESHKNNKNPSLEEILELDREVKIKTKELIEKKYLK
jgi:1-deoxy-D-xylulose-5-phosphate reductoisomerase